MQFKNYLRLSIMIFSIGLLPNATNAQTSGDYTSIYKSTENNNTLANIVTGEPINDYTNESASNTEHLEALQFKYGIRLNVPVESIINLSLYYTIDEWWYTRYRMGGTSKKGIDCSAFMQVLMSTVYNNTTLPRIARDQYAASTKIASSDWQEGDLVFFSRNGHSVGHVGMYLGNNKFVHSSSSKGVMISDLSETYWVKRFVGAGRIENNNSLVQR